MYVTAKCSRMRAMDPPQFLSLYIIPRQSNVRLVSFIYTRKSTKSLKVCVVLTFSDDTKKLDPSG